MKILIGGPFGERRGESWDHGVFKGVKSIYIKCGQVVDFIAVEYEDDDGRFQWSDRRDYDFDTNGFFKVELDYPNEYLKSIAGYYDVYIGCVFICKMIISSNKRIFGPFGAREGEYFLIPSTGCKFIGFFGSYGPWLTSFGAYLEPTLPFKSLGPFGKNVGNSWDDGVFTTVRQITIVVSESTINSIQIDYDNNGVLVSSSRHGDNKEGKTNVIKLEYPDEYVTSIVGFYHATFSPNILQSLSIKTNRRICGPFGIEKGNYFCFPATDGKIIGFHGKCGPHLNSIGAHFEPTSNLYMAKSVGPYGGEKGSRFDDEVHSTITQIRIVHGKFISSINIKYCNYATSQAFYAKHGQDAEPKSDMIELDFPDEYLTSVSGYYDSINDINDNTMTSLTFQSNRRKYGPYGRQYGTYFSFPSFDGKILGFHGRCTSYLLAIGAHVEPISYPKPAEFVCAFGGQGGVKWDDGIHTTIRQLVITCGSIVNSICVEYDKNGHSIWSLKHGESIGNKTYKIKLDYPDEFLISLWGSSTKDPNGSTIIQSLTIQSNKKTYGPFGIEEEENDFSLSSYYGKIIGFHGASSDCLNSIGVYLKPISMAHTYQTFEACGWPDGARWDDGVYTTVRQVIIGANSVIHSLRIEYDEHGRSLWSQRHGVVGGNMYSIELEYPGEYLVSVSGYYNSDKRSPNLQSLTIQSNRKAYGPFGTITTTGIPFSTPYFGGKIIGFHGKKAVNTLSAIGVYLKPVVPITLGLFGGQGGDHWDDKVYGTVRQIQLTVCDVGIESIRFEYHKLGRSVWSPTRGLTTQGNFAKVKVILDCPSEFLISVLGTYGKECDLEIVQSLTFISNRRSYGPFGLNKGNGFTLASACDKVVGFHGRSGIYLDAIGAHIEPAYHV